MVQISASTNRRRLLADGTLAPGARVITIAGDLVTRGRRDLARPDVTGTSWRTRYSQLAVHGTAKLAAVLATSALAERLRPGCPPTAPTPE
ncbi:hypothetical protein M1L60_26615 [Actinoplanes sp. TRM 88003]|uniref:Uncharacterized protein n=1 Tax=Paractinoplanes aksuensis TaxID=2939490 RepID=A0ABT1DTM5_9ACTN|nr:hypothetical protein [Actinoplanes aksuensis]MCO8274178.1 hypothetical protein [Actinoplanes aksuensis]